MKIVKKQIDLQLDTNYSKLALEIALEGKIDKTIELLQKYLNNLSNRDYQRFDEKYVKLIFYCIAMNFSIFNIRSEMEFQRKYPDLLIVPKDTKGGYYSVMIEFKYLKKSTVGARCTVPCKKQCNRPQNKRKTTRSQSANSRICKF